MPSKPSALPARRTPAPSRPTRPRRSAPISTAETAASAQTDRPPIQSPSSTSQRYRSQAMRSRRFSNANRPRPLSRPPHRVHQPRSSRLRPPWPPPVLLRVSQQPRLLRQPLLHHRGRRLYLAASFPCHGREPTSLPRRRHQPSPLSLLLAQSLRGLRSLLRQRIHPHRHLTPHLIHKTGP
jgi:hypothetical protein